MVLRCMPHSGHGGHPGIPFMTICEIYVSPPIPNIEKNQVYEVMTIFVNVTILDI